MAHPIYETVPLSAAKMVALGSDFQRAGFVWPAQKGRPDEFVDGYGVSWLQVDGNLAPYDHPLESAGWEKLNKHPRPKLPEQIQVADVDNHAAVILDPPCPGLLDTCFLLRNGWQFMNDLTENFRIASALLDWALDTIEANYMAVLDTLPTAPEVIVYGDDLGFDAGMYLSDLDFRNFIFPRLQTLFARIRRKAPNSLLCFHSCGAIRSIVDDIVQLDVDMVNLDLYAKNMVLAEIRQRLPRDMIMHAPVNLAAIGQSVEAGNKASLAILATEIAQSMPSIAAPLDNISSPEEAKNNVRGAAFVRSLDSDDLLALRQYGPVKSIIEKATEAAANVEMPALDGDDLKVAEVYWSDVPSASAARGTGNRTFLN